MARKGREWAARRLTEPPGRVPLVRWEPPKGTWGHPWAPGLLAVDRVPRRVCGQSWGGAWQAGEQAWMGGGGSLADSEPLGRRPHEAVFRVRLPGSASRLY